MGKNKPALVTLSLLVVFALAGCSSSVETTASSGRSSPAPSSVQSPPGTSSEPSKNRTASERPSSPASGSSGAVGMRSLPHRTRKAQEHGKREFQHPAAHAERPKNLHPEPPAAASIEDPANGTTQRYDLNSESAARLRDIGMHGATVTVYDSPMSTVFEHYQKQGPAQSSQKGDKAIVLFKVKEGQLLLSMEKNGSQTKVAKLVLNPATVKKNPDWMKKL